MLVYLLFGLLVIGINGLSLTARLLDPKWTRPLGTCSTLIVLNHCCWRDYLPQVLGSDYARTGQAWVYVAAVAGSCIVCYIMMRGLSLIMKKLSVIRLFEE